MVCCEAILRFAATPKMEIGVLYISSFSDLRRVERLAIDVIG